MQPILSPSHSSLCGSPQQSIGQKCVRRELDAADEFTPRCLMRQCIAEQKTLVQEACGNVTDADWNLMASFLSPAKPPLHPCKKSNIHSRPCRFGLPPSAAGNTAPQRQQWPSYPICLSGGLPNPKTSAGHSLKATCRQLPSPTLWRRSSSTE